MEMTPHPSPRTRSRTVTEDSEQSDTLGMLLTDSSPSTVAGNPRQTHENEMHISRMETIEETQRLRPSKTDKTHSVYQKEFTSWCNHKKGYTDGNVVTGDKLHHFLREVMLQRSSKTNPGKKLSHNSLKTVVNAIVGLYHYQVNQSIDSTVSLLLHTLITFL